MMCIYDCRRIAPLHEIVLLRLCVVYVCVLVDDDDSVSRCLHNTRLFEHSTSPLNFYLSSMRFVGFREDEKQSFMMNGNFPPIWEGEREQKEKRDLDRETQEQKHLN